MIEKSDDEFIHIPCELKEVLSSVQPTKTTGLTFEQAMVFLRQGKQVRRADWGADCLCKYKAQTDKRDQLRTYTLFENDWEVVE